jgi:hypothetical protein
VVLVAALGVELVASDHGARRPAAGGAPKQTIVVLDLSGSIEGPAYAEVGSLLNALAANSGSGRRVGLVLFSDVAQEALPPGTKPAELRAYARYFRPVRTRTRAAYPGNPWSISFSGGTRISSGLALARRLLARDHVGPARVLLVSDLFDSVADHRWLKSELLAYARMPGVELRVLPVAPSSADTLRMFAAYLGTPRVALAALPPKAAAAGPAASFPVAFVVLLVLVAAALAGNEIVVPRLEWREAHP